MAGNLESIEIFPGENGGHRVVHNFKREAGKKQGAMGGGVYMERPKPAEHFFGKSEDGNVLPHVGKALNLLALKASDFKPEQGLMRTAEEKSAINRMLASHGLGKLEDGAGLLSQLGFLVQDHEHLRWLLVRCEPENRSAMYDSLKPYLRFTPKALDVYIAESAERAAKRSPHFKEPPTTSWAVI